MQSLQQNDTLVGRYAVERLIGRGGMGAVYLARDTRLGNQVAVKQMLVTGPPDPATQSSLVRAFEREARLLAHLRHPALATVSDYFTDQNGYYLVMQYIPGEDLSKLLKTQGRPFTIADVLRWADQLLDALAYLHSQEPPVVHRDIKPQNIKLTPRGELILLDFGLAKGEVGGIAAGVSGVSLAGYTPLYAPFEQIHGTGTSPQSDLYALGATLYHLLTGQPPRSALDRAGAVLRGSPDILPEPQSVRPAISQALSEFVLQLMALDPARRPASAEAARQQLRQVAGSTPLEPLPAPLAERVAEPTVIHERTIAVHSAEGSTIPLRSQFSLLWALAIALVLSLAFGATILMLRQRFVAQTPTPQPTSAEAFVAEPAPSATPLPTFTPIPLPSATPQPTFTPAPPQAGLSLLRSLRGPQVRVTGLAFTPDGQGVASASDELIRVWNPATGELLNAFDSGATTVSDPYDVDYSPDGLLLATGSGDEHLVKIRRASDGELLASFAGHTDTVDFLRFSPDGAQLASGSYADNSVRLWRVSDGSPLWVAEAEYPRAIAFAPDGTILTIARGDGIVELRNSETGELLRELSGHLAAVDSMAFTADGDRLATGSFDGDVRIWDMATGQTVTILSGAGDTVRGVAFSPDASLLISGSADGFVRLYNLAEEQLISELALGEITSLALAPDGKLAAVAVWVIGQGASVHIVSTIR